MLDFFTDPYKDELMYSSIARYHFYSGNKDYKDTIEECFKKRSLVPSFEFGGNFNYLAKELGKKYDSEKIIRNHTIYPFYEPFLDKEIKEYVLKYMKTKGCNNVYNKLGIVSGAICKLEYIRYCPLCAKNEIERFDEVYIHREHNLQGIIICPHHGCLLKDYYKRKIDGSKIEYIRLEKENLDLEFSYEIDHYNLHLKLSKMAYHIISSDLKKLSKVDINKRYFHFLLKKELSRETGTINQRKLYEEFIRFYDSEFLKSLECDIDYRNEYNWLKVISRKSKRSSHPIRHLLVINFLCDDIELFFSEKIKINLRANKSERDRDTFINNKVIKYRKAILNYIRENKGIKRTELRKVLEKEYIYLYRHDSEWLFNNLPSRIEKTIQENKKVNWKERDERYVVLLEKRYKEAINEIEIKRITKGLLGKPLGILDNLEKHLDKLPKTKRYLDEVCETTKDFQIKRCKAVIDKFIKEETHIRLWEVQKIAAIRTNQFNELKGELIKYVNEVRG